MTQVFYKEQDFSNQMVYTLFTILLFNLESNGRHEELPVYLSNCNDLCSGFAFLA